MGKLDSGFSFQPKVQGGGMLLILLVLPAILPIGRTTQPKLFLDLTAPKVVKTDRSRKFGCGSGGGVYVTGHANRRPELALRLSIKQVSGHLLTVGQTFAADVRLTNAGDRSLALPWDPNQAVVYGKDCRGLGLPGPGHPVTLEGSLVLKLIGSAGEGTVVGGHSLYARMDQPDTYRLLQPGQSAVIRVGGKFFLPPNEKGDHPKQSAGGFKLIAVFDLTDSAKVNPYQPVLSENSVEVSEAGR